MKIHREHPSQRLHHRLNAPLSVTLEGHPPLLVKDWSLGGLGISDITDPLPNKGDEINLSLTLPFQGYDISFDAKAKVVWVDEQRASLGCQFVDFSERSYDLLNYFTEDLIRGHMGTFEDSICRIDVPVTPISTQPSTDHISDTPVRRLPIKTILMSTIYVVLGLLAFCYAGILLYSSFMRLEVKTSVVSTQLQTLKMPLDGEVLRVAFNRGENVKAGDILLTIRDQKLERQIHSAELKVKKARKNIWQMRQKNRIESERLKLYQIVSRTDRSISLARLVALREALKAADAHFLRIKKLKLSGTATATQFDEARKNQAQAAAAVREAELLLEKNSAMAAASDRRHYNHKEFTTDLDLLTVDLEMAYSELKLELARLQQLEKLRAKLVLRAPFDGRIVDLYQSESAILVRSEPLLLLERANAITVTAYLNQQEILQVGLNDNANIFIPALNKHLQGLVIKIDRSSSFLDKNKTQYAWRDGKDRTAAVTIAIQTNKTNDSKIRAGLPVVVIFDRREVSDIWARIKDLIGPSTTQDFANEIDQKA